MLKSHRYIWIIVLVFYSTGCASYVPGTMPSYDAPPANSKQTTQILAINSEVIITLISGEEVRGTILDVTPDQILLNQQSNHGSQKVVHQKNDIQYILVKEIKTSSTEAQLAKGMAIAAGVVLAGIAVLYLMLHDAFGDGY